MTESLLKTSSKVANLCYASQFHVNDTHNTALTYSIPFFGRRAGFDRTYADFDVDYRGIHRTYIITIFPTISKTGGWDDTVFRGLSV